MDSWGLVYLDESTISLDYKRTYEYLTNFFIDFNAGKDNTRCLQTCRRFIETKELWAINIPSLRPTAQTIESMFECICKQLFHYRCSRDDVIILLAFSIELDKCLENESWYSLERLIETLTIQLIKNNFDPALMEDRNRSHYPFYIIFISMLFLIIFILKLVLYK